ncbi:MAG: carboxylating nicotinate-nucleotide diphosphorylase [Verrucomicrobia bacterium]|nr:carboxylating nicotinate-nucleotide diphosphorylase [Verrucomicrobiota bacterium]
MSTESQYHFASKESWKDCLRVLKNALEEDVRTGDITSEACISADDELSGRLVLKRGGKIAGLAFLEPLFQMVDPKVEVRLFVDEGSEQRAGVILGTISGPARAIFCAKSVALNTIQHISGIATLTAEFVDRVEGLPCDILDTRKTHPGMRPLEKYGVRAGGGTNHRHGLDDRFVIKHHHLTFLSRQTRHPILEAVRRARLYRPDVVIEVETENLEMVREALEAGADVILLDHMPLPTVRRAVNLIAGRAYVEVVGGLTLELVRSYAEAGVNGISVPEITFNATPLPIGLRF